MILFHSPHTLIHNFGQSKKKIFEIDYSLRLKITVEAIYKGNLLSNEFKEIDWFLLPL